MTKSIMQMISVGAIVNISLSKASLGFKLKFITLAIPIWKQRLHHQSFIEAKHRHGDYYVAHLLIINSLLVTKVAHDRFVNGINSAFKYF